MAWGAPVTDIHSSRAAEPIRDYEGCVRYARNGCSVLGLRPGDAGYHEAFMDMFVYGRSPWQVAQTLCLSADMIARLGGPSS